MYQPDVIADLGNGMHIELRNARRDHIRQILAALPQDDRYTAAERAVFRNYLEQCLLLFRNETETLDQVERRTSGD